MKVLIKVEYEVQPDKDMADLTMKEQANITGMLNRLTRTRLGGFVNRHFGGEGSSTGWEVTVKGIHVEPINKQQ